MDIYDPNKVGNKNNNIFGFPFLLADSQLVLLPVAWDATVSYNEGTANAPKAIFDASFQLDFYDTLYKNTWQKGVFFDKDLLYIKDINDKHRKVSKHIIDSLENGIDINQDKQLLKLQQGINKTCIEIEDLIYGKCIELLDSNKSIGIVGGEHSVALAGIKAISKRYDNFSILQIDAHADLRKAYEGFSQSHASVMYNACQYSDKFNLTQVGIRDYCDEENEYIQSNAHRIKCFTDEYIKELLYNGKNWNCITQEIISNMKEDVYITFDIDGLSPLFCPNTGTPVPGGLQFAEVIYLLKNIYKSGRRIIGFDLCEVAPDKDNRNNEYDANIGARVLFNLSMLTLMSKNK